jgi:flagellar M-ring protein FliF
MSTAAPAPYPRAVAGLRPLLLLVGIAGAVAAGVSVVLWSRGPTFGLLYAQLGNEDQAQVTQALDAAGIPYRMEPGSNGIQVPSERLSEARLKLAGQGLPEGDGGFALMTKEPGLGVSQFMENARYQHALETELAHTIASLRPVDGARVHVAVPHQSAFVRDRHAASASVFVQLKQGRRLEQEQVQAIQNLVASSIPDLEAAQVTVVDQQGRLLSAPQGTDEFAAREQHFQLIHQMEDEYTQRIEALLTPLVGTGKVRAQVVAQVDTSSTEEAREQYRPESQIVRSEQQSEQTSREGAGAQGVPGSLTNQPPAAATAAAPAGAPPRPPASANGTNPADPNAAAAAAQAAAAAANAPPAPPDNVSKQSTKNYEIDRTLAYTRQPSGRLKRLTVAVLIDNMHSVDKDGKPKERALTQPELDHITALVKDAVGFDESRGDSVNVVNSSFQTEAAPPETELESVPIWERPLFRDLAKLIAGLIVLIVLLLAVLRPLVRALVTPMRAALAPPPEPALAQPARATLSASTAIEPAAYDQQVSNARALVGQDPKRVAQVVRTWVAGDE